MAVVEFIITFFTYCILKSLRGTRSILPLQNVKIISWYTGHAGGDIFLSL